MTTAQLFRGDDRWRALVDRARASGWTVAPTRNHHIRWRSPAGTVVISPGTPSEYRGLRNHRALLRRAGLNC